MVAAARCCAWWCLLARFMRTLAMAPPCGPVDCADVIRCWGIHSVVQHVVAPRSLTLHCDFKTDGGGWTILQQRRDYSIMFYRKWAEYKSGFGTDDTFWLGLDDMRRLTMNRETTMRVELTYGPRSHRTTDYAVYEGVTLGNEQEFYALNYSAYDERSSLQDGLSNHTGPFCTYDSPAGDECQRLAMYGRTSWWYVPHRSFGSDLNAPLGGRVKRQSAYWVGVTDISVTQIKIRPSTFGVVAADCDRSCPNGGTCLIATNGTFHCRCALGYTGWRCETTSVPGLACFCFNGGSCRADGQCACPPGFEGSKCRDNLTSSDASSGSGGVTRNATRDETDRFESWRSIAGLIVFFVFLLILLLIVAFVFFACRRVYESKPSPEEKYYDQRYGYNENEQLMHTIYY